MGHRRIWPRHSALAAAIVLISFGSLAAEEWSQVRIASTGDFAPWNSTDDSGQLAGFEIDLGKNLCTRMGVDCQFVLTPWDGVFDKLEAGEYDAIMASVSRTDERETRFEFSDAYACGGVKFAVAKDSPLAGYQGPLERIDLAEVEPDEQAALDDLKRRLQGKTVGAPAKSIHTRFLDEYMAGAVEVRPYEIADEVVTDLAAGQVDAALSALSIWIPAIAEGVDLAVIGPRLGGGLLGRGVGVVVRKNEAELAAMFSKAIGAASADGTLNELIDHWFGYDASC
jgi:octopine/nopaline transport system substrate-binding protein